MELRFDEEIEKLKNCRDLQEFFEIKRNVLHKIADYIGGSEELHKQIDKTYTNIPDDSYAKELIRCAVISMIKKLNIIKEIKTITFDTIPIWYTECPFCLKQILKNTQKLSMGPCINCKFTSMIPPLEACIKDCRYASIHGCCDSYKGDWHALKIEFKNALINICRE